MKILRPILDKVDVETLLMFGKKDDSVPFKDSRVMKKKMSNSGVVKFTGGHFFFLEERKKFFNYNEKST